MPKIILLNPEEEPLKKNHISWKVEKDDHNNEITLYEIIECLYDHPQAPGEALIPRIEVERVITYKMSREEAAPLLIFDFTSTNLNFFIKNMKLISR
jgi:hypothetical protein